MVYCIRDTWLSGEAVRRHPVATDLYLLLSEQSISFFCGAADKRDAVNAKSGGQHFYDALL